MPKTSASYSLREALPPLLGVPSSPVPRFDSQPFPEPPHAPGTPQGPQFHLSEAHPLLDPGYGLREKRMPAWSREGHQQAGVTTPSRSNLRRRPRNPTQGMTFSLLPTHHLPPTSISEARPLTLGSAAWAVTLEISVGDKTGNRGSELSGGHSLTIRAHWPDLLHTPPPAPWCSLQGTHPADLGERGPPCLGAPPVAGCQPGVLWSNFGLSPGLGVWTAPGKDHRSSGLVSTYCAPGAGLEAVQASFHLILHTNPVR